MISELNGLHETVRYKKISSFCLYDNKENEGYPVHWHIPMEIIMPYREDYTVKVCNKTYKLQNDSILFISPGVLHSINEPSSGERLILQIDLTNLQNIKSVNHLLNLMTPCLFISKKQTPELYQKSAELINLIKSEYQKDSDSAELNIYTYMFSLFTVLSQKIGLAEKKVEEEDEFNKAYGTKFIDVCNYISENCTTELTLDKISSYAGFSKYHFARLFKDFTGVTFYKYLNQKRIFYAQSLLLNPDTSITDIAYQSGFESMSAFIRMFKIFNECTPTEYRNMYIHLEKKLL